MNFPHTTGKGIINNTGLFRSAVDWKYLRINYFFPPPPPLHIPIYCSAQAHCKKTSFAYFFNLRHNSLGEIEPVSEYKSSQCVREIEFPMNTWLAVMCSPQRAERLILQGGGGGGGGVWAQGGDAGLRQLHRQAYTHVITLNIHAQHNTARHTYVMTRLWETEPQRVTITHSQQVAGSCLFVCDFRACCAHMSLRLQPAVHVSVCAYVCVDEDSCLVEFLLWCTLLPSLHHHIYRPLEYLCSVTPQNSSIMTVINPHAKSLLNSAPSVFYTKDAIISFVVHAPLQRLI